MNMAGKEAGKVLRKVSGKAAEKGAGKRLCKTAEKISGCMAAAGIFLFLAVAIAGCGEKRDPLAKIKDLDFTVIAEENIPEALLVEINDKKKEGFKMTYQDNGFVYICLGYGEQPTGGYSITVDELYETENAVYFNTTLLGPDPSETEGKKTSPSCPYVVVKTEMQEKPIVFE